MELEVLGEVSASMSISGTALSGVEVCEISRLILNMALSFPGPMPPRNLKEGVVVELGDGGRDM